VRRLAFRVCLSLRGLRVRLQLSVAVSMAIRNKGPEMRNYT